MRRPRLWMRFERMQRGMSGSNSSRARRVVGMEDEEAVAVAVAVVVTMEDVVAVVVVTMVDVAVAVADMISMEEVVADMITGIEVVAVVAAVTITGETTGDTIIVVPAGTRDVRHPCRPEVSPLLPW